MILSFTMIFVEYPILRKSPAKPAYLLVFRNLLTIFLTANRLKTDLPAYTARNRETLDFPGKTTILDYKIFDGNFDG